jgi:hypothetical protein
MRTPGRLIMIPPTKNIVPLTIAADVPMFSGFTTSLMTEWRTVDLRRRW